MKAENEFLNGGGFGFSEKLVLVKQEGETKEDILRRLADLLEENGYVKESYYDALLEREAKFPTGIITNTTGVAIPHTDIEHVNQPAIAVATLKTPVLFNRMDDFEEVTPVNIIIMLAIKDSDAQLKTLQKIMFLLQKDEALSNILAAEDAATVVATINKHLSE